MAWGGGLPDQTPDPDRPGPAGDRRFVCLPRPLYAVGKGEENLAADAGAMERLRWLPGEGRSSPQPGIDNLTARPRA